MKVNSLTYKKNAAKHADLVVKMYGIKDTCKMVSNVIHDLSTDADAIYNTYQIFYYANFLKHIKENYDIQPIHEYTNEYINQN